MSKLTFRKNKRSKSPRTWRETIFIIGKSAKGIIITLHNKDKKWSAKIIDLNIIGFIVKRIK